MKSKIINFLLVFFICTTIISTGFAIFYNFKAPKVTGTTYTVGKPVITIKEGKPDTAKALKLTPIKITKIFPKVLQSGGSISPAVAASSSITDTTLISGDSKIHLNIITFPRVDSILITGNWEQVETRIFQTDTMLIKQVDTVTVTIEKSNTSTFFFGAATGVIISAAVYLAAKVISVARKN